MKPSFDNLVQMLNYGALSTPHKTVMTFLNLQGDVDAECTYSQLEQRAISIAHYLRQEIGTISGSGEVGERALLLYAPGIPYIEAFFGCLYAGVVPVPAYPPMGSKAVDRLKDIIDNSGAKLVLSNKNILPLVQGWFDDVDSKAVKFLETETTNIKTGQERDDGPFRISSLLPSYNRLAFLQYTSGSTGSPKGVMIKHGQLLENLGQMQHNYGVRASETGVSWLPPYHDMGLIGGILLPIYVGGSVTLMPPMAFVRSPYLWLKTISDTKAVVSAGPDFAYRTCVEKITAEQKKTLDLSHWRIGLNGAEPISENTMSDFYEAFSECGLSKTTLTPCYGLAEACLMVTSAERDKTAVTLTVDREAIEQGKVVEENGGNKTIVSSGKPPRNINVAVVDPVIHTVQPAGTVGELWLSGPNICTGYWGRPVESEKTFNGKIRGRHADNVSYLKTGDYGAIIDGEVFVTGRLKDLIILRGKNYYPQDIENSVRLASDHLRATCSTAFSISAQSGRGGERLIVVSELTKDAYVKLSGNQYRICVLAIEKKITENHGVYVDEIIFLRKNETRKTSSGKIMRAEMKILYLSNKLKFVYHWKKRFVLDTPLESRKTEGGETLLPAMNINIIEDLEQVLIDWMNKRFGLSIQMLDLDSNFTAIGLDSVDAVEVVAELERLTQQKIAVTELFKYPTIRSLIEHQQYLECTVDKVAEKDKYEGKGIDEMYDMLQDELLDIQSASEKL